MFISNRRLSDYELYQRINQYLVREGHLPITPYVSNEEVRRMRAAQEERRRVMSEEVKAKLRGAGQEKPDTIRSVQRELRRLARDDSLSEEEQSELIIAAEYKLQKLLAKG